MNLASAIDVFTRGFAVTRSRTHPYLVERIGPLWLMRDAPRKGSKRARRREYVALDADPAKVARIVRRTGGDGGYVLCVVHDGQGRREEVEAAYKRLGFRYLIHEPMFVRRLPPAPRGRTPVPTRRVTDIATARLVAKAARRRQIDEADVTNDEAASRLYAALDNRRPVGWVSSIRVRADAAWVANLYVERALRSRGIGAALMRAMLRDDLKRGVRHSVLLASQAGARLYRRIGYEQIGTLQMFIPPRT